MQKDHTKLICDIGEISDIFHDTPSLESFLQRIVEMISEHMRSEVCSIYLYYEDTGELVLKATKGLNPSAVNNVRLKMGEGLTGLAVKEVRAICERQASKSIGFRYFPEIGEEPYESFLAVPIVRGQTRIGAVVIQNSKKNYFSEDDIRALRAITSQLANTIEAARLFISLNDKHGFTRFKRSERSLDVVKGRVGSKGFAFAQACVMQAPSVILSDGESPSRPAGNYTLQDFHGAVSRTEKQLENLQEQIEEKLSDVASLIFAAQILMLKDKVFLDAIVREIESGVNPPSAVVKVVNTYVRMFEGLPTPYLREKKHDVRDIGNRLLENLTGFSDTANYTERIVIAQELFPSDILKLSTQKVRGIVLLSGGITSHLSILARSLAIPLIITDHQDLLQLDPGTPVLLDAEEGTLYIQPTPAIIDSYQKRELERSQSLRDGGGIRPETRTKDGTPVHLLSNINLLSDLKLACQYKCEGVGLYRTEFPFMVRSDFPSEEEQFVIYRKLVDGIGDREITFRTLDIGGDKVLSYYDYGKEENPFLGMRSIRFSLKHKDIFVQQLRAILRAGVGSRLRIMFPMISSMDEFLEAKELLLDCVRALKKEGTPCHPRPQVGMMVELPAVLEIIDDLAGEADFFSIGTNDFIQYMLAVDRTNEKVADLYLPHHPAILRALKKVVDAAAKQGRDLSICGDMAHSEKYLPYFLGIGIRKLSLDAQFIPKIQRAVAGTDLRKARQSTERLLAQNRISEINRSLGYIDGKEEV